jgi:asparagine synthase (glutamine-hydrolysing)
VCLINSLIAPQQKRNVGDFQKVVSAISQSPGFDERPFISEVVNHTKAQPVWVEPSADGFMEELDQLLWHQEEPFAGSSVYAQWRVFCKARESGIKVMLDGQGADEQLCGYRKFTYFFLRELIRRRKYWRLAQESISLLGNYQYYKAVDLKHGLRYFGKLGDIQNVLNPARNNGNRTGPMIGFAGSMAQRIKLDLTKFSLPALLRYEDKNSMAFSIESRVPFLDFRLVEFIAGLPLDAKLWHGWTKHVLRMSMRGIIPEAIRLRKDKLAFDTPQNLWIRTRWKDAFMETYKKGELITAFLDREKLIQEFDSFLHRRSRLSGNFFFRSFILHRWAERFSIQIQ